MPRKRKPIPGVSSSVLAEALGVSLDTLYRLKDQGVFKQGRREHYWATNPIAARPTYRWNKDKCLKVWEALQSGDHL